MLAHVLSALGLAVFTFEVYRTVGNFGHRRQGLAGGAVSMPAAHMAMALLMGLGGFAAAARLSFVPAYVPGVIALVCVYYFAAALRFHIQRRAERKARAEARRAR